MSNKSSLDSPIYLESLKALSHKFDLKCLCEACGWSEPVSPQDINYFSLKEFQAHLQCPECNIKGLDVSITAKI